MKRRVGPTFWMAILCASFATQVPLAHAQGRLSDKDVEALMTNLRDDAKSFRPRFESAVRKSAIRKTSRERDARALAARFQKQTEAMRNNFKRTRKADTTLPDVISSAQRINTLVYEFRLDSQTTAKWESTRAVLDQVAGAFGMTVNYSRPGQGPQIDPDANAPSCLQAVGAQQAKRLVDECLQVSPATRPPCNAQNSCMLIIDEIKRGCGILEQGAPAFCNEYK